MTLKVRRSRREESDKMVAIWARSVDATHSFLSARDIKEIELQVRDFLPEAPLWVAVTAEDKPVAFMLLSGHHMEALFVDPEARGGGAGRLLVEHAISLIPELTTDVNEQNQQAVGFYQKLGFIVTGRSATDGHGRPYPLLHLQHRET